MAFGWLRKLNPYYHRAYVRELLATRAQDGPYRFLLRTWSRPCDFELSRQVLSTDLLHGRLEPLALPIAKLRRALVLAPHQDDEVLGCGGALLHAADAGCALDILFVTTGEQTGGKADATTRASEARAVCATLDAGYHTLDVPNRSLEPSRATIDALAEKIQTLQPEVVFAPWILDLPPAHRMTCDLLSLALARHAPEGLEIWGYQVEAGIVPNGYVDVTAVEDRKLALLAHYASQLDIRAYDHLVRGRDAWNSRVLPSTPEARFAELFFAVPADAWRALFDSTCARDPDAYYRGRSGLADRMRALRAEVSRAS